MSEWQPIESAPTNEWITAYYWPEWNEEPVIMRVRYVPPEDVVEGDPDMVGNEFFALNTDGDIAAFPFTHWKPD